MQTPKIVHNPPLGLYDKVIITSHPLIILLWKKEEIKLLYAKPPYIRDGTAYYLFNEEIEVEVDYNLEWEEISKHLLAGVIDKEYDACNFIYAKTMGQVEEILSSWDQESPPYLDL